MSKVFCLSFYIHRGFIELLINKHKKATEKNTYINKKGIRHVFRQVALVQVQKETERKGGWSRRVAAIAKTKRINALDGAV